MFQTEYTKTRDDNPQIFVLIVSNRLLLDDENENFVMFRNKLNIFTKITDVLQGSIIQILKC